MNFRNLQCIIEIWKCGSINRAAGNLFISQSSLSHTVRSVEQEIGYPIFTRSSSGIDLTREGVLFIQSAQTILSEYRKIKEIPGQFACPENLSIACTSSALLMRTFLSFVNLSPAVGCRDCFRETGLTQTIKDVVEQNYRMGIFYCFESREAFHRLTARRYQMEVIPLQLGIPLEVVLPSSSPYAAGETFSCHDLAGHHLITYENFDSADWLDVLGLTDDAKVTYIFDRSGLVETIKTGKYISVVSKDSISADGDPDITILPLSDFNHRLGIYMMISESYQPSEREKQFIRYLKDHLTGEHVFS